MDGFGNINWWGFSPSVDLLQVYKEKVINSSSIDPIDEINILLVNAGDQRHILKTLASKDKNVKVNFFVYEKMLELYAKHFLLISLALQHPARMSVQEKTELYLELYGNILIREYTSQLVIKKANEFIKYITDLDHLAKSNLSFFDFSSLKFKERDFLEGIFKFWRLKNQTEQKDLDPMFPASKCWDVRLRNYFSTRYDVRTNAFDWDFQMKLMDRKNCAIINNRVYSSWRNTGVAYELRDSAYDTPNKTLASGMIFNDPRNWEKISRRGYFGDIIVGPFLAYGIESENMDFYKKQNDHYRYTSMDVAKANLSSMLQSILELSELDLNKYRRKEEQEAKCGSAKITEIPKLEEIAEKEDVNIKVEEKKKPENDEESEEYFKLDNFKFKFLPLTMLQDLGQKSKYDNFFNIVYFGNSGITHMNESMKKVLKKSGESSLIVFETVKHMIELKDEQISALSDKIREIGKQNGLVDVTNYEEVVKGNGSKEEEKRADMEQIDHLFFKT